MSQIWWRTINLQAVLLGSGTGWAGGCAGVGRCICPLSAGDVQLATSWQNPEPLVWLELRAWDTSPTQYLVNHTLSIWHIHFALVIASFYLLQTNIHLPSFLQVRLGGGMPLDSHTRVMRLPSVTVRGDTSSEPRILGETVIMTGHQKGALTSHSSYMQVHFTEVKKWVWQNHSKNVKMRQENKNINRSHRENVNNKNYIILHNIDQCFTFVRSDSTSY